MAITVTKTMMTKVMAPISTGGMSVAASIVDRFILGSFLVGL